MIKSPIFPALSLSSIIWFTTSTFPKDSCTTLCVHVETRARLSVTILLLNFLWRSALSKSFLSCYFILLVTWKRNVERVRDKWLHSKQMWKGEEQNYMLHYSIGLLEVPKSKVKWKYVKVHTRKTVFNVHPLSHFPLKFSQRTEGVPLFPINRFDFVTTFVSTLSSFCWILKLLISPAAVRSYLVCQIPSSSHQNQYPEVCSLSSSKVLHTLPSLPAGSSILLIPSSSYSSVGAAQQL